MAVRLGKSLRQASISEKRIQVNEIKISSFTPESREAQRGGEREREKDREG